MYTVGGVFELPPSLFNLVCPDNRSRLNKLNERRNLSARTNNASRSEPPCSPLLFRVGSDACGDSSRCTPFFETVKGLVLLISVFSFGDYARLAYRPFDVSTLSIV